MEGKSRISWLWIIPIALVLPAYHLLIFALQFGWIDSVLVQSIVFVPAGLIEGAVLVYCLRNVKSQRQWRSTLMGFVIGFMFAFFGSLLLPLLLPAWFGATIGGALPWVLCTWIGYRREPGYENKS